MVDIIIRASSLSDYPDCQRRWAARTLSSEVRDAGFDIKSGLISSIGASVGTAVHAGAAHLLEAKMAGEELSDSKSFEAQEVGIDEITGKIKEGVMWDSETSNLNEAQQQVKRMVQTYRQQVAYKLEPVAVERRLTASVGNGFVLSGQSDLQTLQPGDIRDTKTGRLMRVHYAQIGAYSLLARTVHRDFPVNSLHVDFIQRVTMKKPQPDAVEVAYDQPTAELAAHAIIDAMKKSVSEFRNRVEDGDAPPEHAFLANPSSMLCSSKYCNAWGSNFCKEHKGARHG